MLLYIIDTTGSEPQTLGIFKAHSATTRPGGIIRVECVNDRTAQTLAEFLAGHAVRFVHTGPEVVIDLDSSDFDFSAVAGTTPPATIAPTIAPALGAVIVKCPIGKLEPATLYTVTLSGAEIEGLISAHTALPDAR